MSNSAVETASRIPRNQILLGHVTTRLREIEAESFHSVIFSSPYWGMRNYNLEPQVWGGDEHCQHDWQPIVQASLGRHSHPDNLPNIGLNREEQLGEFQSRRFGVKSQCCRHCEAWLGQYGLEPTPEVFIHNSVLVGREIWRILRPDGILWWNIGESFFGSGQGSGSQTKTAIEQGTKQSTNAGSLHWQFENQKPPSTLSHEYLKPKDICMIPFHLGNALQRDGWCLRYYPWLAFNKFTESTDDRPTTKIEFFLMLTKSNRHQYWAHPQKHGSRTQPKPDYRWEHRGTHEIADIQPPDWSTEAVKNGNTRWRRFNLWEGHDYFFDMNAIRKPIKVPANGRQFGKKGNLDRNDQDRQYATDNPLGRSWRPTDFFLQSLQDIIDGENGIITSPTGTPLALIVNVEPYHGKHYAAYSQRLIAPLILASTSGYGCCEICNAPYERCVETQVRTFKRESAHTPDGATKVDSTGWSPPKPITAAWQPTCDCKQNPCQKCGRPWSKYIITVRGKKMEGLKPDCQCLITPALILDPFSGVGTTLLTAKALGRDYVGIDLSENYCKQAKERLKATVKPFTPVLNLSE